jgi:hypothetical protein
MKFKRTSEPTLQLVSFKKKFKKITTVCIIFSLSLFLLVEGLRITIFRRIRLVSPWDFPRTVIWDQHDLINRLENDKK